MYKTIINECPNELPSRRQRDFVNNLIDQCPDAVNKIVRPSEGEAVTLEESASEEEASSVVESSEESSQPLCAQGARRGQQMVRNLWRDQNNSDCNRIFGFPNQANSELNNRYPKNDPDFQRAAMNNCARDAANKELASIQEKCFATPQPTSSPTRGRCRETGRQMVRQMWRDDSNSDCNRIFGFSDQVNNELDRSYSSNNRRDTCVRDAADEELKRIQADCFATPQPTSSPSYLRTRRPTNRRPESECVPDTSPRPVRDGVRFRIGLVKSDAQCVDSDGQTYETGTYYNVKDFTECAEACVNDVPDRLAVKRSHFRGIDYDCESQSCSCLYDEGTIDKDTDDFDRSNYTNRRRKGSGSIRRTARAPSHFCGKVAGSRAMDEEFVLEA